MASLRALVRLMRPAAAFPAVQAAAAVPAAARGVGPAASVLLRLRPAAGGAAWARGFATTPDKPAAAAGEP